MFELMFAARGLLCASFSAKQRGRMLLISSVALGAPERAHPDGEQPRLMGYRQLKLGADRKINKPNSQKLQRGKQSLFREEKDCDQMCVGAGRRCCRFAELMANREWA